MIDINEKVTQNNVGLSSAEAIRSREENGENILSKSKQKSFIRHFFGNLGDPVTRILLCALIVNLFFVFHIEKTPFFSFSVHICRIFCFGYCERIMP